jgi:acetyl esterase
MPVITPINRNNSIDPITQSFLETFGEGTPPLHKLSLREARIALAAEQARVAFNLPADIEDRYIYGGPTGNVSIRIVRPLGSRDSLPAIMYFHGGGWTLGNKHTHDRLVRQIAVGSRAAVVFVNYSRSPEAKYPIAIEQCYSATNYIAEHGSVFNLDGSRLAVAGDSTGGNIAAAVTLLSKQRGGPPILYQALLYPVTDAGCETKSYAQFAGGPWLTRAAMQWFWESYAPDRGDRWKITASPLRATRDHLVGLPPALVITGEYDVLRDEGEAYARRLAEAGVRVVAVRYVGAIHDFMLLNAMADSPAARSAVELAGTMLRSAFAR